MRKPKLHFFICTNTRPPFAKTSCGHKDSNIIVALLKEAVEKHNLKDRIKITSCGCLGPCENGPMIVIYPQGTWYHGVGLSDVDEIINNHLLGEKPVKKLIYDWPETEESK